MARLQGIGKANVTAGTVLSLGSGDGWNPSTGGSTIVVGVAFRTASTSPPYTLACADNTANVYTQDTYNDTNHSEGFAFFRCSNALSASTLSVTAGIAGALLMFAWEESGLLTSSPVDVVAIATAASTPTPSSNSITTTNAGDTVFALLAWIGSTTDSGPHTGGFAVETPVLGTVAALANNMLAGRLSLSATGAHSLGTTISAGSISGGSIVSYKQAAAAPVSSLQVGYALPGATGSETYHGTLSGSEQWAAITLIYQKTATAVPSTIPKPTAVAGNGQAAVNFNTPNPNGSALLSYNLKIFDGSTLVDTITGIPVLDYSAATGSPYIAGSLTNLDIYQFEVAAVNGIGLGTYSAKSLGVMPTPGNFPDQPAPPSTVVGDGFITVNLPMLPNGNGSSLTNMEFICYNPDSSIFGTFIQPAGLASYSFIGLINDDQYGFTVIVSNGNGPSPESDIAYDVPLDTPVQSAVISLGSLGSIVTPKPIHIPTYVYLTADLLTNQIIDEIQVMSPNFTNRFNDSGTFQGNISISDPRLHSDEILAATIPTRTALYILRDNRIVWGGIIWARDWIRSQNYLQLNGREFWSYFDRRRIVFPSPSTPVTYTNKDQIFIAEDIIKQVQAQPNGNIGCIVQDNVGGSSGVIWDQIQYLPSTRPKASDSIVELLSSAGGADFCVDVELGPGDVPLKFLNFSYPHRGNDALDSGFMFEFPGNIIDYQWTEDGIVSSGVMYGFGAKGISQLTSTQVLGDLIAQGYPLLEDSVSYLNVTNQAQLDNVTLLQLYSVDGPVTTPILTIDPSQDPVLGSYRVGDEVRVRITDDRFPSPVGGGAGIDTNMRIALIDITPPTSSGQKEIVKLSMVPSAASGISIYRLRDTFSLMSQKLERRVRILETT